MKYYWDISQFEKVHLDDDDPKKQPIMESVSDVLFIFADDHEIKNPECNYKDENGTIFQKEELEDLIKKYDQMPTKSGSGSATK